MGIRKLRLIFTRKIIFLTFLVIAVLAIAASTFFFFEYQKAQNIINESGVAAQIEAQNLAEKVSHFISLPEGEIPTVATVSDKKKLAGQSFFEKSENGDKVLIYTKAKKAYLYRPSTDRLIDVTIVNVDTGVAQKSADAASSNQEELEIVLRNGTATAGLTHRIEPEVKKVLSNAEVITKENAGKSDYEETSVIVLNENASEAAALIADYLNVSVSALPEGESRPVDGDLLIIIGQDNVFSN